VCSAFWSVICCTRTVLFQDGFSGMVVEEASARHVYRNIYSVQEDHFGVCKPRDKRSTSYLVLKKFIESVLADNKQKNNYLVELPSFVGMKRLCKVSARNRISFEL